MHQITYRIPKVFQTPVPDWKSEKVAMALKDGWTRQGKQRWASSWTDPPSPRPPRWVFWLVRPHKASNPRTTACVESVLKLNKLYDVHQCNIPHAKSAKRSTSRETSNLAEIKKKTANKTFVNKPTLNIECRIFILVLGQNNKMTIVQFWNHCNSPVDVFSLTVPDIDMFY